MGKQTDFFTGKKYKIVKLIDSKREEKENSRKMTETFDHFYKDLKATEKADSVLTPTQQIDRLLRPGSTYRNLNPYEVLQIDPKIAIEDVRKKYRRLSIQIKIKITQKELKPPLTPLKKPTLYWTMSTP